MLGLRGKRREPVVLDAEPADHGPIATLHASAFTRGWGAVEIARLSGQENVSLLVARRVGEKSTPPLGFNIIRQTAFDAEILSIAVDPKSRKSGIGGLLMREAIRRLQHDRVGELFLEVDAANEAAVALYRKLGFKEVGKREGYYDGGKGHALVMRLDLARK
ncbi:ribosomal protein S18-alanine N-acetyltransferase [Ahrensia sp. R2A130]|uniref:ribosomal protein S18-alanine N-acetyltransferase n=1 Tax=Ahrensia sp. R2A130 TaxID=744979 RepID=UPI0001E09C8D|nr:ribosomal protein S18-alanine N-acetyltransferase [Ahrensia sp. R2A130]EFL88386.1 ribosomal-protein-alanine acetyltransferase [Ahrensia sp. R2A130]